MTEESELKRLLEVRALLTKLGAGVVADAVGATLEVLIRGGAKPNALLDVVAVICWLMTGDGTGRDDVLADVLARVDRIDRAVRRMGRAS